MRKIFLLGILSLIGYHWISFFRFCHPFPKSEFYTTLGIQFAIPFAAYIISPQIGRIMTVICALLLVRIAPILGMQSPFITLMGVFLGGVVGNLFRSSLSFKSPRHSEYLGAQLPSVKIKSNGYSVLLSNPLFLLILFLIILSLDRFLLLFNAPYLKGFGILETMYVKGVSSKEAFALSMETISDLLFPLLYFYSEELQSEEKEQIRKDWKIGAFIGLGIQFLILLLQVLWDRILFAANTNLSLEANRVMGLFRDSGSSTWIVPILCFLFYKDLLTNRKYSILLIPLIGFQLLIAPYQGRGFWLLFLLGFVFLLYSIWKENRERIPSINRLWGVAALGLFLIILYQIPRTTGSTFDKLLRIPMKVFSLTIAGENPFLSFDPQRYYFNFAAWKVFLENPFFGTGIGSFLVNLKDPTLSLFIPESKIDNPSFFMGVLSEIGVVGVILITLYFVLTVSIRDNFFFLILFLFALSFGYHIVQPDGGFVVLFVLMIGYKKAINAKTEYPIRITMIILIFLTILHSVFQVIRQGRLPEFRQEKLNSYQLLAYELNHGETSSRYHVFKGKTIWVLAGANGIELDAFLDSSTSKKSLRQKWTVLDNNRKPISDLEITIEKNKPNLNLFRVPDNGYYLQVEELDDKGNPQFYGDVPFCVPVIHFTEMNQFL